MKRILIVLGGFAVVFFVVALEAAPQDEIEEESISWKQLALGDGKALYGEFCAVCHGSDGKGEGPAVSALSTPVPDLTRLALGHDGEFPAKKVRAVITGETEIAAHGSRDMPMWGDVFGSVRPDRKPAQREAIARLRIYDLASYLESIQVPAQ